MKRIISVFLIIAFVGLFPSCGKTNVRSTEAGKREFDVDKAVDCTKAYVGNLMSKKYDDNEKLFSESFKKEIKEKTADDRFDIVGYSMDKIDELPKSAEINVKVVRAELDKPHATLEKLIVTVTKEKEGYKIDKVENKLMKEAFLSYKEIRLRSEDNVKDYLLIRTEALPSLAIDKEAPTSENKITLDNNKLSFLNLSYSGDKANVVTYDKDSMIASIVIDESAMAVALQQGGSGGEGGDSQNGTSTDLVQEKPVGKIIKVLGVIKNAKVNFTTYSEDNLYLIAQYKENDSAMLKVYNTDSGEELKYDFKEKFDPTKFQVVYKEIAKDKFTFNVIEKDKVVLSKEEEKLLGEYTFNYKTSKAKKGGDKEKPQGGTGENTGNNSNQGNSGGSNSGGAGSNNSNTQ